MRLTDFGACLIISSTIICSCSNSPVLDNSTPEVAMTSIAGLMEKRDWDTLSNKLVDPKFNDDEAIRHLSVKQRLMNALGIDFMRNTLTKVETLKPMSNNESNAVFCVRITYPNSIQKAYEFNLTKTPENQWVLKNIPEMSSDCDKKKTEKRRG